MAHHFKFFKGRRNVERFRINVRDPVDGNNSLDPNAVEKIELVMTGSLNIVISSSTGEITWENEIIQIKPSLEQLTALPSRTHSALIVHKNGEDKEISNGIVEVVDYG